MSKTDDLSAWRVFVTVARSGTLSAAAKALDVEVSSISRAIGGLEKALGCELIRRNMRPMKLTEAGQAALKRMETILRAHDGLMEALVNDNRALTGGTEADVAKGFVDVAVITGEPTLPGLVYVSRGRNLYLPVASPDYISRNGLPVTPEQLRQHRGYIYAGPVRPETKVLRRGAVSAPVEYGTAVRSTDVLAIREAVLSGMGVAADMPLVQIYEDLAEGRLVPILPGWSRPPVECYIVTNRDAWHMKRVRVFFEWFAAAMRSTFAGYERAVSSFVGLPPDNPPAERTEIRFTESRKRRA